MPENKEKRVYSGYYTRHDGAQIFVVTTATDADTGEETVIFQEHIYAKRPVYRTMALASFCGTVEVNGKSRAKFKRQARRPVDEGSEMSVRDDGFQDYHRRRKKKEWSSEEEALEHARRHFRRCSHSYYDYAKDLAENFKLDLRIYNLCLEEKRYIGVLDKSDFLMLKEDLLFLRDCRKTVLRAYNDYFKERFFEGNSIRKYAEAHGLNRGSVDYLQRKFFTAFAAALEARDKADGKCRLYTPSEEDEEDFENADEEE